MGKAEFSFKGSWCAAQWPHSRRRERASKKTGYGFYNDIAEGLVCYLDTNAQLPPASSGGFFWSHYKDMLVYFYNILKIESFYLGCVIENGWCFISWNSKGITNKIPQSWSPPAENWRKSIYFSAYCRDKTTMCYDRAFIFGRVIGNGWCFFLEVPKG